MGADIHVGRGATMRYKETHYHGESGGIEVLPTARVMVAELDAKALGYADDEIVVKETIRQNGEYARGLAKSRIAVRDHARTEVYGTTEGNAAFARGHVDCVEIVRDEAVASAVPVVKVTNDRAQVTHEASIGTVAKKELETLMARGLDEDTAVDVIVRGMLEG